MGEHEASMMTIKQVQVVRNLTEAYGEPTSMEIEPMYVSRGGEYNLNGIVRLMWKVPNKKTRVMFIRPDGSLVRWTTPREQDVLRVTA